MAQGPVPPDEGSRKRAGDPRRGAILRRKGRFLFATALGREGMPGQPDTRDSAYCRAADSGARRVRPHGTTRRSPNPLPPASGLNPVRVPDLPGSAVLGGEVGLRDPESDGTPAPQVLRSTQRAASHFRLSLPAMRDCLETRHQGLGFASSDGFVGVRRAAPRDYQAQSQSPSRGARRTSRALRSIDFLCAGFMSRR